MEKQKCFRFTSYFTKRDITTTVKSLANRITACSDFISGFDKESFSKFLISLQNQRITICIVLYYCEI